MLNYLVKSIIFICIIWRSFIVEASDISIAKTPEFQQYNYFKIKAGAIQPTPLDGNTGLGNGNNTYTAGFTVGRKLDEFLSADIEYMYRGENTTQFCTPQTRGFPTTWTLKSNTIMLNMALDLMTYSKITPYVRAGAGVSINQASTYAQYDTEVLETFYYPGKKTKNFAWQIGCGINFSSSSTFSTELEYMFVNRGTVETQPYHTIPFSSAFESDPAIKANLLDHVITIGLKIKF